MSKWVLCWDFHSGLTKPGRREGLDKWTWSAKAYETGVQYRAHTLAGFIYLDGAIDRGVGELGFVLGPWLLIFARRHDDAPEMVGAL